MRESHEPRIPHQRAVHHAGRVGQRLPRLGATCAQPTGTGQCRVAAADCRSPSGESADLRQPAHHPLVARPQSALRSRAGGAPDAAGGVEPPPAAPVPPVRPDAVWVADITFVETQEGLLYVAGVWTGAAAAASAGRWATRCTPRCPWPRWTWCSRNAARPASCSIIPTRASNMPAANTDSGWHKPGRCRA